ncbi:hypothetical protein [Sphingorhabdus contaminans]|uniref:hypothetical protein n=1 Tax=Sphingorhabdus contaminans TaxID=1343899 RepID=UPI003D26E4E7
MSNNMKFPPSVEIKRAIAAAERAGIQIRSIEIQPRKIVIVARDSTEEEPKRQTYAEWKVAQRDNR